MSRKLAKVSALIQLQAASIVSQSFVSPNIAVTVTKVDLSPDIKNATVYVSLVGIAPAGLEERIAKLAPGLIAKQLAANTALRSVPHLQIRFDDSGAYAEHISSLIHNLKED